MNNCVGIILAGGKSRRMGKDKSLLDFQGRTLLQRMIDEHRKLLDDVYVIGKGTEYFENATGIYDKIEDKGPVGGLFTALSEIKADWYLISPCDMPFLNHTELKELLEESASGEYDAIIAESDNGYEPLVAAYSSNIFPLMQKNMENGNYAVRALFNQINKRFLKFNAQIFEKDTFFNINYRDDYNNAIQLENKINKNKN
jgi:molybdopterin-guanine dinucleotide biosynthesis protein A